MKKDISRVIEKYVYFELSDRDDIVVKVEKTQSKYNVRVIIKLKPTDGLVATLSKGIDKYDLIVGLREYLNLDWDNCTISVDFKRDLDNKYYI